MRLSRKALLMDQLGIASDDVVSTSSPPPEEPEIGKIYRCAHSVCLISNGTGFKARGHRAYTRGLCRHICGAYNACLTCLHSQP